MLSWKAFTAVVALVGVVGAGAGVAQTGTSRALGAGLATSNLATAEAAGSSSSLSGADASAAIVEVSPALPAKKNSLAEEIRILPFSRVAIGTKLGTLGWGGQIATPIARWLNLRGGADFVNFGYGLTSDGTNYYASLHMKSGTVQADYYPFRQSSFHLSPGALIFRTNLNATMNVPGGGTFTENNTDYTSDPTDPVNGNGTIAFQRSVMPMFTLGFGNMISRHENRHWSAPFEIGAAYTGHYALQVNLAGSGCQQGYCMSVNDPSIQQNVVQQTNKINEEAKHFQILPIITTGVAYRF